MKNNLRKFKNMITHINSNTDYKWIGAYYEALASDAFNE